MTNHREYAGHELVTACFIVSIVVMICLLVGASGYNRGFHRGYTEGMFDSPPLVAAERATKGACDSAIKLCGKAATMCEKGKL